MAPALDPLTVEDVKATRARPLTGLIPTARGIKGEGAPTVKLADGKVRSAVTLGGELRFITANVELAVLATSARLRTLSTATATGADATQLPETDPRDPVQSEVAVFTQIGGVPREIKISSEKEAGVTDGDEPHVGRAEDSSPGDCLARSA